MQHSESIAKIAEALAAFQADVKDPRRDGNNPHFRSKYVQIDALLSAVRPILSKHGLSVVQSTGGDGQNINVTTMILHQSGEWIETDALNLRAVKADPQGAGSAVTYGRRYSLSAALGVAWDDDDDGEAASTTAQEHNSKQQEKDNKHAMLAFIVEEGKAKGVKASDFADIIKAKYKKAKSSDLTEAEVQDLGMNYMKYMSELVGG